MRHANWNRSSENAIFNYKWLENELIQYASPRFRQTVRATYLVTGSNYVELVKGNVVTSTTCMHRELYIYTYIYIYNVFVKRITIILHIDAAFEVAETMHKCTSEPETTDCPPWTWCRSNTMGPRQQCLTLPSARLITIQP